MILINFGQNITSDKMYLKLQAKFLHSVFSTDHLKQITVNKINC